MAVIRPRRKMRGATFARHVAWIEDEIEISASLWIEAIHLRLRDEVSSDSIRQLLLRVHAGDVQLGRRQERVYGNPVDIVFFERLAEPLRALRTVSQFKYKEVSPAWGISQAPLPKARASALCTTSSVSPDR